MILIAIFLFGLMIGSFLNVLIARFQELETVVATRSHCPHCRQDLAWYDLFPLLSFVILAGRCRYCREKISWQYPLVELLTALIATHLLTIYGLSWLWLGLFAIFALLIVVAAIDLQQYIIPDVFMLPVLLIAIMLFLSQADPSASLTPWAVLIGGGGLALLVVLSKEHWMGAGDIGLGALLGLLAGFPGVLVGLVLAFVLGAIVGLAALLSRRKAIKDPIPFGPFLVIGTYVATIWGSQLVNWYLVLVQYY